VLVPRLDQDRADSVHDNNSVVALGSDSVDEDVAVVPEGEVVAVALVAIEDDVAFTGSSVGKDDACTVDLLSAVGKSSLLGNSVVVDDALDRSTVAKNLGLDGLKRSDQVREVG
jgi:hypothetical protein